MPAEPKENHVLVNLTPHPVTVYGDDGQALITVPSDGSLRLTETAVPGAGVDGIPTTLVLLGEADEMPPTVDGTTYIVSMPLLMGLAAAGTHRPDMVYPYGQVRDETGRIIGCRSLARIATAH